MAVTDHDFRRQRVVIEGVSPELDAGRFAVKRIAGDQMVVEADIFADGHDQLTSRLLYRRAGETPWRIAPMRPLGNDRWRGTFTLAELGGYEYTLEAWVDRFRTWRHDFAKRVAAGHDVDLDLRIGSTLLDQAASRTDAPDAARLSAWAAELRQQPDAAVRVQAALDPSLAELALAHPDRNFALRYDRILRVTVDRERARFSTWYELFPRSCAPVPNRHGTLRDCAAWLEYVAAMGFDVLYLPPIHPIGRTFRKGRNNAVTAAADDVGSPWAIGAREGGHLAVHPDLGTIDDFRHLVGRAAELGLEVALDLAFQCTPDHPYVREHREWFRTRPDGTIQYAENPPKKYQDIYPLDFDSRDWEALWLELKRVILFWVEQGVTIFRIDNPHTKPFAFWEWVIEEVKSVHPDVLFLSEAFTRPRVMERLAKLGFSWSYTYFTWRNTGPELREYFTYLAQPDVREFFRPHLWPNTPDILSESLQTGGRPVFVVRAILAATLGANYGIYGPAFELCENVPRAPGSEEYLDSEKYELKHRDLRMAGTLEGLLSQLNRIRREHAALQRDDGLRFHDTDNPSLLCYSKSTMDASEIVLMVINLDPVNVQSGWVSLDLESLEMSASEPYEVHDLLGGGRYHWHGPRNYVELSPQTLPAHVLLIGAHHRTERDAGSSV